MHTQYRYGFRVLGNATEARRLIDWAAAFRGHADCDARAECSKQAYLSAFTFSDDFRQHLEQTQSTRDFVGACWASWLWFDVDRGDLGAALEDTRRLVAAIEHALRIPTDDLLLFFSGSKGFHVGVPTGFWRPEPGRLFHRTARRFAESIAQQAGIEIDTGVYDRVRLFRAPNSRHPKTGWYKTHVDADALMHVNIDGITSRADRPASFEIPEPTGTNSAAADRWRAAAESARAEAEAKLTRQPASGADTRLNRGTLQFIRDGAGTGDRHRLLYSSAANLQEFGAPPPLVHALLTESALDAGLSPSEVRRCIDNALSATTGGGDA